MLTCAVLCAALVALVAAAGEDGDSAAFAVAVEGGSAVQCGGALVSLRAALTVARCTRGAELWVRAATGSAAVRVERVAVADPLPPDPELDEPDQWMWGGVGGELALLELEAALPATRPIIAAPAGDCAPHAECYVPRLRSLHLRIVEAEIKPAAQCVARGARWPTPLRERAFCLLGPRLCESDWGAGVVCGGKLCGVMSQSAQSVASPPTADGPEDGKTTGRCGDTHAAASVPHARRFLHCAFVRGACGSGDCERLCSERLLESDQEHWKDGEGGGSGAPASNVTAPTSSSTQPPTIAPSTDTTAEAGGVPDVSAGKDGERREAQSVAPRAGDEGERHAAQSVAPHAGDEGQRRAAQSVAPRAGDEGERRAAQSVVPHAQSAVPATDSRDLHGGHASTHSALEFEPNRPDFKMGVGRARAGATVAVAVPTKVVLKAGEYGENAAEYGAEYAGAGSTPTPTRTIPAASTRRDAPRRPASVEARHEQAATTPAPPRPRTSAAHTHTPLCILTLAFVFGI